MPIATASRAKAQKPRTTGTGNKIASTVAKDHDLSLEELRGVLDDPSIKERTPFRPTRQQEVADVVAAKATNDQAAASTGGQLVTTRTHKSKGAFQPTRLKHRPRLALTPEDIGVLRLLEEVIKGVRKAVKAKRASMALPHGEVGVPDVLIPERLIPMSLAEYQQRSADGTLPLLHQKTKDELAAPFGRLSLVNHSCRICGEPLETPPIRGMLERVLNRDAVLPFKPNDRNALKYRSAHEGCPKILDMMTEVELELEGLSESEEKEETRWLGYIAKMQADNGQLLKEFMESEYHGLSAKAAMARLRAILDNIKEQRELYS